MTLQLERNSSHPGQIHLIRWFHLFLVFGLTLASLGLACPTPPARVSAAQPVGPTLAWNTFLGGASYEMINAIVLDESGFMYVLGSCDTTWGNPLNAFAGGNDAFVAKLDKSGALQWSTFLGGTGNDMGRSIAIDGNGDLFVGGYGRATWGTPLNAYAGGTYDVFVAKMDSSGALLWNSFLGGSGLDGYGSIAVDGSGNAYVTGFSDTAWGSPLHAYSGEYDTFIAKLNGSGTVQWTTFLGGSGFNYGNAITTDGSGNAYVTGYSYSTWGSPLNPFTADQDAYVVKLDGSGAVQWNTFMGGLNGDGGSAIAVDGNGNAYVTGYSFATWGSPLIAFTGGEDAFVAQLSAGGVIQWTTFLGGEVLASANAIALDSQSNIYVAGSGRDTWGDPVRAFMGIYDVFVARLNNSGTLQWNTFLGGADEDYSSGISVDSRGSIYVTGTSNVTWGSPLNNYGGGGMDGFISRIGICSMDIQGVGISISPGDSTPNQADQTDFGSTAAVSGQVTHQFDLLNSGDCILSLSANPKVSISGPNASDFTLFSSPSSPLDAGDTANFVIQFDPSGPRLRSATVTIANDSDQHPLYSFSIQGTGVTPVAEMEGNNLVISAGDSSPTLEDGTDFGTVALAGSQAIQTFELGNSGNADLLLSGIPRVSVSGPAAADFKVLNTPYSPIQSGNGTNFVIQFDPSAAGLRQATVSITNNSLENPYTFTIQGTGGLSPRYSLYLPVTSH